MAVPIRGVEDAGTLALAIVDTIHEPLLVLDAELRVLAASRAFYAVFQSNADQTLGRLLYDLGDGQWNIPALRLLLETIIPEHTAMDGFEVDSDFPGVGPRIMLLNARQVRDPANAATTMLLAFTDVTARRAVERERADLLERTEDLLRQKQTLLEEMHHRIANSLQIIASILMMKARAVGSEETRQHLRDAHQRVLSIAEVQSQLHSAGGIDQIEVGVYLSQLCASLGSSMIGEGHPIAIRVEADRSTIGSDKAVSMGLIVTELVINAIKYAFPIARSDATITVGFEGADEGWTLSVRDNGVGHGTNAPPLRGGLGTAIVEALVKQLGARLETVNGPGVTVTLTHPVVRTAQA